MPFWAALPFWEQAIPQSPLAPHTPMAAEIAGIAWLLFIGAAAIFLLVLGLVAWSVFWPQPARRFLASRRAILAGGLALPVVLLSALLAHTLRVAGTLVAPGESPELRIEVVGEQFWWRVHYLDAQGRLDVPTANEIHLPAGRLVEFQLRTADVIHSFWIPSLAGKIDMVPGRTTRLRFRPDRVGVFRGQCAEYCGAQHANMAFLVVVDTPDDFERWRAAQRQPASFRPGA